MLLNGSVGNYHTIDPLLSIIEIFNHFLLIISCLTRSCKAQMFPKTTVFQHSLCVKHWSTHLV